MRILRPVAAACVLLNLLNAMAEICSAQPGRPGQARRPVIRGRHYAVASMKPEATIVAERILRAGGNAFDAAVAGQAVLSVVDAELNGLGGDAMILVYDARAKQVFSINGGGTAPRLATIEWYQKNHNGKLPVNETLLAGTVPGVVDTWYVLLERWGTMSLAEVLQPAIDLAEDGFPLHEGLAHNIGISKKLRKYPTSLRLFYPGGKAPLPGQIFHNADLARTLKALVAAEKQAAGRGRSAALRAARDWFYKGDIARAMARFSEENRGLFRYEDFAAYTAKVEKPVSVRYRGYDVFKNPSANQGPAELFLLKLLEGYDLKALGHNSADYIHVSAEAAKLALADREKYLGDMDFIHIPFEGLLSNEYTRSRRALIDIRRASAELRAGTPEKFTAQRQLDAIVDANADHDGDTSYIGVVDRDRNMVSFTPSLHSVFGTNVVMADLGFALNCRGDYFSLTPGHANALAPGKRPRTTLQSTLVLKDGKPAMILGSPGGDDQCMRTLQTFLNIVEFGMNIQQAIEAPRWSTRSFPGSTFPHTMRPADLGVEDRIPASVQKSLIGRGHKLRVVGPWMLGETAGIIVDPETGVLSTGADPRVDAYALAW